MKTIYESLNKKVEIAVIGTGMGSLTAAALLAKDGHQVSLIEQNYLPGGCTSSYFRQGYIFEAGATTLVGLDDDMPMRFLMDQTGVEFDCKKLATPMKVHLKTGETLIRYQDLDQWIAEAERVFGPEGQRPFWELCYKISQFVWQTSLRQQSFPPSNLRDFGPMIKGFQFKQLAFARWAFVSMTQLLKRFNLNNNAKFIDFVNEQLLITAQNKINEVNALFGATALCYTNYGNYYVYGGLYQMIKPFCDYVEAQGGELMLRTAVEKIIYKDRQYYLETEKETIVADKIVSGIPINNLLEIWDDPKLNKQYKSSVMDSKQLNSAFQMGIGFRKLGNKLPEVLHHQIHLEEPLPGIGSDSIFISYSAPEDWYRAPQDSMVASISTHIPDPEHNQVEDKAVLEELILEVLDKKGLIKRETVVYYHSSAASSWERWTGRKYGFVGGYPQYLRIKPWQMLDARIDGRGAYLCGDTAYPGQGIPGVCLSGIIAWRKMKLDGLR
jgi:C-3',4' desaturase CrtD